MIKGYKKFVDEGPNDPAIFKAIFLAGGPGSGKSFIAGKTSLKALGYKVVNSDDAFENAMKKAGMTMDPETIFSTQGQELRDKATDLTAAKKERYIKGRLGLVIDGTGKDFEKIRNQANELKRIGYDVAMLFVNTDMESAVRRNQARARTLPDSTVITMWKSVQKNIGKFQGLFKSNFLVVDNSDGADFEKSGLMGYKWATKFTNQAVTNVNAIRWINSFKREMVEGTLAARDVEIIDSLLGQIKTKLMQDSLKGDMKDINDIAKMVKKRVEKDTKHKGWLRLKS